MPELLDGVEGEPLQVELSQVRILFELLGFLLSAPVILRRQVFRQQGLPYISEFVENLSNQKSF
ncbi:MAG TPA: hypothetical protein VND65_23040 [Candidatus Binatia bacterium]|nr:hypothetical protein [Candidatus Binatia bacterium]